MMQKIGIGYEDYREFIEKDLYYVDKTSLVKDIVEKGGKVTLFTRPRRFGKTLALSMLRTFFEEEYTPNVERVDKTRYFAGKQIMDAGDHILSMMGMYSVISLSLKSAQQPQFHHAILKLRDEIVREYRRHAYLRNSDILSPEEQAELTELSSPVHMSELLEENTFQNEAGRYSTALRFLSVCLQKHHGRKTIILLDEYDVPLENAYSTGFYPEMAAFIHSLFESARKTNDALEFAVITGCLPISKESIFPGMNNLAISSIRDKPFSSSFGFTPPETEKMLGDYGLEDKKDEVHKWYNGYLFGDEEIYNPWSITYYVYDHRADHDLFPKPYWSNTSSNQIVRDLVEKSDEETKNELDLLIEGGTIEKRIHEDWRNASEWNRVLNRNGTRI